MPRSRALLAKRAASSGSTEAGVKVRKPSFWSEAPACDGTKSPANAMPAVGTASVSAAHSATSGSECCAFALLPALRAIGSVDSMNSCNRYIRMTMCHINGT
jgi:hypothetical protein